MPNLRRLIIPLPVNVVYFVHIQRTYYWRLKFETRSLSIVYCFIDLEPIWCILGVKTLDPAQLSALMDENSQLKQKIEQIEGEMEHRALRGDFNLQNTKILHFK